MDARCIHASSLRANCSLFRQKHPNCASHSTTLGGALSNQETSFEQVCVSCPKSNQIRRTTCWTGGLLKLQGIGTLPGSANVVGICLDVSSLVQNHSGSQCGTVGTHHATALTGNPNRRLNSHVLSAAVVDATATVLSCHSLLSSSRRTCLQACAAAPRRSYHQEDQHK